jgi:DNA polymerase-1
MGKALILDANSIIHRAFHALPPLTTKKGEPTNAVYGFLLVFFKIIKEFNPDYIVSCFDFPAPTFRHKEYKEYKAKRAVAPESLYKQIPKVKDVLQSFNVPIFEEEGFEADDLVGTLAEKFRKTAESIVVSGDKDALQLVDMNTKLYLLRQGIKNISVFDERAVEEQYGIPPGKMIDFKALRGDPSDNIPGALGAGEKTAIELVKKFGSVENLYDQILNNGKEAESLKPSLRSKLIQSQKNVFFSKQLVEIKKDVSVDFDPKKCRWGLFDREKAKENLQKFGFRSLAEKIPETGAKKQIGENFKLW